MQHTSDPSVFSKWCEHEKECVGKEDVYNLDTFLDIIFSTKGKFSVSTQSKIKYRAHLSAMEKRGPFIQSIALRKEVQENGKISLHFATISASVSCLCAIFTFNISK